MSDVITGGGTAIIIALLTWILKKLTSIERKLGEHEAYIRLILRRLGINPDSKKKKGGKE